MTEFRKKLQKQEGWYVEGENFDVLAARTKEGGKYQYMLSVSISKKHKLFRKAGKEKTEFALKLFNVIGVPDYGWCVCEKNGSVIVMRYSFPDGFNSLNEVMECMERTFNQFSNIK